MSVWLAVLLVGAGSMAFRAVPLLAGARPGPRATEALQHAALAALVGIAVTGFARRPLGGPIEAVGAIVAVVVAAAVVRRGHGPGAAAFAGLGCYWLATAASAFAGIGS
jgi:hypothetical protein